MNFSKLCLAGVLCGGVASFALGGNLNGPYVGLGLGYSSGNVRIQHQSAAHAVTYASTQQGVKGYRGNLFLGYAYDIQCFHLGAEANAILRDISYQQRASVGSAKQTFRSFYGINFVPGYYLTQSTLLYGKAGFTNGHFKFSSINSTDVDYNKSKSLNGWDLGLGSEIFITKALGLRLEYTYTNFERATIRVGSSTTKYTPSDHFFMLGIDYHFDFGGMFSNNVPSVG